jgi:hypothetical protein
MAKMHIMTGTRHTGEKEPDLGDGARFAALKGKLADRPGVKNPGALAAYIGRKKYGNEKMEEMAEKGRKK